VRKGIAVDSIRDKVTKKFKIIGFYLNMKGSPLSAVREGASWDNTNW
jgi:hypothetical protein